MAVLFLTYIRPYRVKVCELLTCKMRARQLQSHQSAVVTTIVISVPHKHWMKRASDDMWWVRAANAAAPRSRCCRGYGDRCATR